MTTNKLVYSKKIIIPTLIVLLIVLSLTVFLYNTYNKLRYIERSIDAYVSMYIAHVANEFRRFKYDNIWIGGLHYFDAYASLYENRDVYAIASRLKRYSEQENFDKLNYEDALYIADFLDSMLTVSPPTSDEVFEFLNYLAELNN